VASKLSNLFDIRNVIGALMAIYGVVLTIAGFAPRTPAGTGERSKQ
jgi:hypothetical protein